MASDEPDCGCGKADDDLILVRHAESEGNVAREAAESAGAELIDIDLRDPDVPLTPLGEKQAAAFGQWLSELPAESQVASVWCSPYVRTVATAAVATERAGLDLPLHVDERLRDRELGMLDRLTKRGIASRYPGEAERRRYLGKFYYRPPGGESWADVVLRLRSFLADREVRRAHGVSRGPELVVTHDAVILLLRYVLEGLTERQVLDLGAQRSVGNASITWLHRCEPGAAWRVHTFGAEGHLDSEGDLATHHGAERDTHPR
ncbi:MAG TPA: histidine phosphatase family protein [Jatrophihabitans sp.]|nr:histidine phosphatase family protein [Jatrophihabitans sp.]